MNPEMLFTMRDGKTLQKARETYGAHKQIGVAAEECTELAKELIKAFRYDDFEDAVKNTKDSVVDEVADVLIVLDHVLNLYSITQADLQPHISRKMNRLRYWLSQSDSIEFTTKIRTVDKESQAEAEAFEKYQQGYYQEMAYVETPCKITGGKGVYHLGGITFVDNNDKKYREDNE